MPITKGYKTAARRGQCGDRRRRARRSHCARRAMRIRVFVDLRDPRELEREGKIPGAFHCPRGMLEFWIDPDSPYHKPIFAEAEALRVLLRQRLALGAVDQDGAGYGPGQRRASDRRLHRVEGGDRPGREVTPKAG